MTKRAPGSQWDKRRLATLPDLSDEPPSAELAMEIARHRAKEVLNVVNWQLSTLPTSMRCKSFGQQPNARKRASRSRKPCQAEKATYRQLMHEAIAVAAGAVAL